MPHRRDAHRQRHGLVGGLLNRMFHMHTGVQFMGYYVAVLTIPAVTALLA